MKLRRHPIDDGELWNDGVMVAENSARVAAWGELGWGRRLAIRLDGAMRRRSFGL